MTNLARISGILFYLLITLAPASSVLAQDGTDEEFRRRLESAVETGDAGLATTLIEQNRLKVKPIVNALVSESLSAALAGDSEASSRKRKMAESIASTFDQIFEEKSLVEAASYLASWTVEERRLKLAADSLHDVATGQRSNRETRPEALENYMQALAIYRQIEDRVGAATTLGGIGFVYWYLGNPDSTLAYIEAGLEARREVDDRELLGNSLNDMAAASRAFLRDYEKAVDYYSQSVEIRAEVGDSTGLAKSLSALANTYVALGKYGKALDISLASEKVAAAMGDSARLAGSIYVTGRVLSDLGRHSEALLKLERGLEIFQNQNDLQRTADVLNMIGAVYRRIGDYDAALERYQDVVRLAESEGNKISLAYALLNTGAVLDHAYRPEHAIPKFERARSLFAEEGDHIGEIWSVVGLSNSYLKIEDYSEAENYAEEALELSRGANEEKEETRALITLANAQVRLGKLDAAMETYLEARRRARAFDDDELSWQALMGLGERFEAANDYEEAIRYYTEALDLVETVRGRLQTEQDKAGFFAERRFAYENIIHLYGRLYDDAQDANYASKAFRFAERAKARSFLDLLSRDAASSANSEASAQENELLREIGRTRRTLQQEIVKEAPDRTLVSQLERSLDDLEEAYQNLQRDRRVTGGSQDIASAVVLGPEEVQSQMLREGDVLLQYAVGDSSSSLWVVTNSSMEMFTLPERSRLEEKVAVLRFALSSPDQVDRRPLETVASELYEVLVAPAKKHVAAGKRLIVVPDGVLHYLPFEALFVRQDDPTESGAFRYLLEHNTISYAPSASVLLQLKNDRNGRDAAAEKQLIAFGDPYFGTVDDEEGTGDGLAASPTTRFGLGRLPYSGDEVRAIARLFPPGQEAVFLRDEATEERVKTESALQNYRFVHFATHGIVDEQRPDFSGLVLAQNPSADEDGFLQAAEISNMKIDADLAVLSACETGLGKMVRGEGLVGLTQAFMSAGVPSIVVSLWRVADESTSVLMERFYAAMIEREMDAADALRRAKLEMIQNEEYDHPFHWAPFIMIGKTD